MHEKFIGIYRNQEDPAGILDSKIGPRNPRIGQTDILPCLDFLRSWFQGGQQREVVRGKSSEKGRQRKVVRGRSSGGRCVRRCEEVRGWSGSLEKI